MRSIGCWVVAAVFLIAGAMHLLFPAMFIRIVPPGFPAPRALVLISGVAEMVGGAGVLIPRFRRAAGWGLIALLVCVFPANVYMAMHAEQFAPIPPAALYARLPLQAVLMVWVWWVAVRPVGKNGTRKHRGD